MRLKEYVSRLAISLTGVIYVLVFSACAILPNESTMLAQKSASLIQIKSITHEDAMTAMWLDGVPCAPPCWEGIIPGSTTFTDTIQVLSRNPYFDDIEIIPLDNGMGIQATRRIVADSGFIKYSSFHIDAKPLNDTGVVTGIFIHLSDMSLQDVIANYGPPSHVWAYLQPRPGGGQYWGITLIWMPLGLELRVDGDGNFPLIDESFVVGEQVNLFSPGLDGYNQAFGTQYSESDFFPWEGYGNLADKATILD